MSACPSVTTSSLIVVIPPEAAAIRRFASLRDSCRPTSRQYLHGAFCGHEKTPHAGGVAVPSRLARQHGLRRRRNARVIRPVYRLPHLCGSTDLPRRYRGVHPVLGGDRLTVLAGDLDARDRRIALEDDADSKRGALLFPHDRVALGRLGVEDQRLAALPAPDHDDPARGAERPVDARPGLVGLGGG